MKTAFAFAIAALTFSACGSSGQEDNYNDHAEPEGTEAPMGTPVDTASGVVPGATDTMLNDTTHMR